VPLYDPESLSDLIWFAPAEAAALLAALDDTQRRAQAGAYTRWLGRHHLPTTVDEVLAAWATLPAPRAPQTPSDPPLDPAELGDLLQFQPRVATALLAALDTRQRHAQAAAYAAWLHAHHLPTTVPQVLAVWQAMEVRAFGAPKYAA
jgi:hypothetical protein